MGACGGNRGVTDNRAVDTVAKELNASVYAVAIAWLLRRSRVMLPIADTSSIVHLEENMAAAKLQLSDAQMKALGA